MNYKPSYKIMAHAEKAFRESSSREEALEKAKVAMLQKTRKINAMVKAEEDPKNLEGPADEALIEANVDLFHILNRSLAEAAQALRVSKHQIEYQNGAQAWVNLLCHYQRKTVANTIQQWDQLINLQMDPNAPGDYFRQLSTIQTKLEQSGSGLQDFKVTEGQLIILAIKAIPKEFALVKYNLVNIEQKKLTLDQVMKQCLAAGSTTSQMPKDHAYYSSGSSIPRCTNPRCSHLNNHDFKDCFKKGGPKFKNGPFNRQRQEEKPKPKKKIHPRKKVNPQKPGGRYQKKVNLAEYFEWAPVISDEESDREEPDLERSYFAKAHEWLFDADSDEESNDQRVEKVYAYKATTHRMTHNHKEHAYVSHRGVGATEDCWIMDTGASAHITSDVNDLTEVMEAPDIEIQGLSESTIPLAKGTARISAQDQKGKAQHLILKGVLASPQANAKLISAKKLCQQDKNTRIILSSEGGRIHRPGKESIILEVKNGIYYVKPYNVNKNESAYVTEVTDLWHLRLGHANHKLIEQIVDKFNLPKGPNGDGSCLPCGLAKSTRKSIPKSTKFRSKFPLELVSSDIWQASETALGGFKYVLLIVDHFTRSRWVYFMPNKTLVLESLKKFIRQVVWKLDDEIYIRRFRSDRGSEYTSKRFQDYLQEMNITFESSPPYAQAFNGIAERSFRSLEEKATAMMLHAGLPQKLWALAIKHAQHLLNRLPTRATGGIPLQMLHNKEPDFLSIRIFGSIAYVRFNRTEQRSKPGPRSSVLVYVGEPNDSRGVLVWNPNTNQVCVSYHAQVDERILYKDHFLKEPRSSKPVRLFRLPTDEMPDSGGKGRTAESNSGGDAASESPPTTAPEEEETENHSTHDERNGIPTSPAADRVKKQPRMLKNLQPHLSGPVAHEIEVESSASSEQMIQPPQPHDGSGSLRRSARVSSRNQVPTYLKEGYAAYTASRTMATGDPSTFEEAIESNESFQWQSAMAKEMESHKVNRTFKTVPVSQVPKGAKIIPGKWVLTTKHDQNGNVIRYKARYVMKGFSQREGIDYHSTFAPTVRSETLRLMLALCAALNWPPPEQSDFVTAFLNSDLDVPLFARIPKGQPDRDSQGRRLCWFLLKSIYGLKQAGRRWWKDLDKTLIGLGFKRCPVDPCLYYHTSKDGKVLLIAVYVDDLLDAGNDVKFKKLVFKELERRYKLKRLGTAKWLLGVAININKTHIMLDQSQYIRVILERFNMSQAKPMPTPADHNTRLSKADSPQTEEERSIMRKKPFRSLVGALLYLRHTRPDVANATRELTKFVQDPGIKHWKAGQRILRYLKGTVDLKLKYRRNQPKAELVGAVDAEYRRSQPKAELVGAVDADWANDQDNRRSITGYTFSLSGGAAVTWSSRQQDTVAGSSTEAEYIAANSAVKEAVFLRQLLRSMGQKVDSSTVTTVDEDNQACIKLSEDPVSHNRTKHIDVKHHYIREKVEDGIIKLRYVPTTEQLADCLTKNLAKPQFLKFRDILLGH